MNQKQIDILLYIYFQEKPNLNNLVIEFPADKADIDFVIKNYCFVNKRQDIFLSNCYDIVKVKKDNTNNKRGQRRNFIFSNYFEGDLVLVSKLQRRVICLLKRKYDTITVYLKDNSLVIYNSNNKLKEYKVKNISNQELVENNVYLAKVQNVIGKTILVSLIATLGECDHIDVEINRLIAQSEIRREFTPIVVESCEQNAKIVHKDNRVDLSNLTTFTIDNDDTKDIDDAISIVEHKNYYELYVHIADVSEYVIDKSAIDKEASIRSFSVYPPNGVIPMLPSILSEDFCSLTPNYQKLCLSTKFIINKQNSKITSFEIFESIIKVKDNLSYSLVDKIILENTKHCLDKEIKKLHALYLLVSKLPLFSNSLNFADTELGYDILTNKVVVKNDGSSISSQIIEKMMILTNYYIATFLEQHKVIFPYRVQEKPLLAKLFKCNNLLRQLCLFEFSEDENTHRDTYQKNLSCKCSWLKKLLISELLLQTQTKATYSLSPQSHYALAIKPYTHFTAPIRRYSDIIVHRQIKSILAQGKPLSLIRLKSQISQINLQERVISSLERKMQLLLASVYYENNPFAHKAIIANANAKGFYIKLTTGVLGFVPINTFSSFFLFNSENEKFYNDQISYRVGDEIIVDFIGPNYLDLYLDFKIHDKTNN